MAEHIELEEVVLHAVIFEMRGDGFALGVVRRVLDRAEILDVHIVRHDDEAAGMLTRRAAHADAARRQAVDLGVARGDAVFLDVFFDEAVGRFLRERADRARAEDLGLAEHLDRVRVRARLIFAREVQVDIRHLAAAVAEEGLKRDVEAVLDVFCAADGAQLVGHIRAAAVLAAVELHVAALGAAIVRRQGVDLGDARHVCNERRADRASRADKIAALKRALHELLRRHINDVVLAEDAAQLDVQSVDDELRQLIAVERVRLVPDHAVEIFLGVFKARREELALGQKLDVLHLLGDGARVGHDDLVGFFLAEIVEFPEHFVGRAEVERHRLVRVGKFLRRKQDVAVDLVLGVEEMDVARRADGLAELLAELDDRAVEVLQILVIAHRAVTHEKAVVAQGLDLKKIIERGDALELVPVLVVDDGAEQLARLAGGADDQALAVRDQLAFGDGRHALEVLEVRCRDELIEIFEADLVFGDEDDVLRVAAALRPHRAQLCHLAVDLLKARDAARFEYGKELHEHLRHGHRVVRGAVVVELRELQVVGHDIELVLGKLRQEVLREDERVEIRRLKGDAALFAARADEADVELRVVRGERTLARKIKECVQRIL